MDCFIFLAALLVGSVAIADVDGLPTTQYPVEAVPQPSCDPVAFSRCLDEIYNKLFFIRLHPSYTCPVLEEVGKQLDDCLYLYFNLCSEEQKDRLTLAQNPIQFINILLSTAEVACVPETNLTLSINDTEIRVLGGKSGNATDTNDNDRAPPSAIRTKKNQSRSVTGKTHENSGSGTNVFHRWQSLCSVILWFVWQSPILQRFTMDS